MSEINKELIKVNRDCDAILIPGGEKVVLVEGTHVRITQSLGGNFTVLVNGNLVKVSGKDAEKICNLNHQSCFGKDSPFAYLINNDGKNLYIGLEKIDDAFTFDHVAEEESLVEYRFFKEFSGTIIDKLGKKKNESYKMYVRDLNLNVHLMFVM